MVKRDEVSLQREIVALNDFIQQQTERWSNACCELQNERDTLRTRIAELEQALEMRTKERDNAADAAREYKRRMEQYRDAVAAKTEVANPDGAYHYWLPGEDNGLESLVCPVVIPAQWLRDLLEEAESKAAQALTVEQDARRRAEADAVAVREQIRMAAKAGIFRSVYLEQAITALEKISALCDNTPTSGTAILRVVEAAKVWAEAKRLAVMRSYKHTMALREAEKTLADALAALPGGEGEKGDGK